MNNKKIGLIVVGIIVLIGTFYGGVIYGKNTRGQMSLRANRGPGTQAFTGGGRGAGGFGGFTAGKIIAKDDKSITVQLMTPGGPNGTETTAGSKIIFLGSDTKISKSVDGSPADLAVGTQVTVSGMANTDGSVNATTVQIRPQTMVK